MKKIVALLLVVVAVLVWGIVGATFADEIGYDCKAEAGPLCFYWEKNGVGKALDAASDAIDDVKEALE